MWPHLFNLGLNTALVNSISDMGSIISSFMTRCGLCTDSRECPFSQQCQCSWTTRANGGGQVPSCTCVDPLATPIATTSALKIPSRISKNRILAGNWTTNCEPIVGTGTSERHYYRFGVNGEYESLKQSFSGHKCDDLMTTEMSTGTYFVNETLPDYFVVAVAFESRIITYPEEGLCSDTCTSWFLSNGRCDDGEGSHCAYGTDCSDCGARPTLPPEDLLNPTPVDCPHGFSSCQSGRQCFPTRWACDG